MSRKPRLILGVVMAALLFIAVIAGSLALMHQRGYGPWAFSLSWAQMDAQVDAQTITATDVTLEVWPLRQEMTGVATITFEVAGGESNQALLLLNPGFSVLGASLGAQDLRIERYQERLRIELPPDVTNGELELSYNGWPVSANSSLCVVGPEELLLDRLQFWYPLDLKSFGAFSASLRVPERYQVVWSGALETDEVQGKMRHVRWRESRPLLARGLAIGQYESRSRVQGGLRCSVFAKRLSDEMAEAGLAALGDAHNYLSSWLGPDEHSQMNMVISPAVDRARHAGGPLVFVGPDKVGAGDAEFAEVAALVARNWWGGTVSGRWFSNRPEAGEWLASGMAEYSAWRVLRSVRGRRSYLRFIENQTSSARISIPMKTINLDQRLRPEPGYNEEHLRVRGAFTASLLSRFAGADAFDRACRNFMSVHRFTTVSFAALLHEVSLASEEPLDELVRVWFDQPGVFDYGIENVAPEPGQVYVTVSNKGDIPVYVTMQVGVVTDVGYHTRDIDPVMRSETVRIPVEGTVQRVVLDPEFEFGDMRRQDNIWPRTEWPARFAVGANGRVALRSQPAWGMDDPTKISVFSRMDKAPEYSVLIRDQLPEWMQWDAAGNRLLLVGSQVFTLEDGVLNPSSTTSRVPLGWYDGNVESWGASQLQALGEAESGTLHNRHHGRNVAINPGNGDVVASTPEGNLLLWKRGGDRFTLLKTEVYPAESMSWKAGENAVVYFERGGDLVETDLEGGGRKVLLHRNYEVRRSRVSGRGSFVAWVDPAGLLRAIHLDGSEPVYISLPGEVVDFAWEGQDALIALVAEVPRRLPMRYHASYGLWRIPVSTWQGAQLPYDPVQFAAASAETSRAD